MYIYLTDFSWLAGEYEKSGDGTKRYRRMAELKSVELVFERAKSDLGLKENCKIVRDEKGKPHIEGAELYISISHSQSMAAVALSEKPVGIDIQVLSEENKKITERFFSDDEKEIIKNADNKKEAFTAVWTVKEANFKLCGDYRKRCEHMLRLKTDKYVLSAVGENAENAKLFIL
ncbi:MAG: 4'-phosphopantetheinyl transferase superfamily protein [Ruminococcaceae bacterium]|nr:4'-phosphopantetheinyl transferase superfamily protein [Oscillospiraceae bacterium]